jgi:flagellar motor protein MotB
MFAENDDDISVWPGYVDFMSTFIFILLIFVGALLYILSGDIGDKSFRSSVLTTESDLTRAGIQYTVQGRKIVISLKGLVKFESGCPDLGRASCKTYNDTLSPENEEHLRVVATIIANHPGCRRIVIEGLADSMPYPDPKTSEFKNFELSARRAMQVLKFFHDCPECDKKYDVLKVRPKLALSGLGSKLGSEQSGKGNKDERRVDVILDYSEGLQ